MICTNITPEEAYEIMHSDVPHVILDVRRQDEYDAGHVPGAVVLPLEELTPESAARVLPEKDRMILVYCRSGRRSAAAARTLSMFGYTDVRNFGGIMDWEYEIA